MAQTDGGGRQNDLVFTPEQMEHIREELEKLKAKYTAIAREKQAARDRAGTVSPADLEFGRSLQREYQERYTRSAELFGELLSKQIWAGKMPEPPPMPKRVSKPDGYRPKKPSLLKRLANRLHSRKRKDS